MAAELAIELLCMILPLKGRHLLVPSVNVAEVINSTSPQTNTKSENWDLGTILWRQSTIPLMDFESFNSGSAPVCVGKKIAVMNVVSRQTQLSFFAIVLQETPHLIRVHPGELVVIEQPLGRATCACVELKDEQIFIPDLSAIEQAIFNA